MKDICKRLEIDTKMYKEKMFLSAISSAKDELIDPIEFETRAAGDYVKRKQAQVYREYQQALKQNNALDFDDLIMKPWNCSNWTKRCSPRIRIVSAILWWMSIRIPIPHSLN